MSNFWCSFSPDKRIFHIQYQILAFRILVDLGHLAFDERNILVLQHVVVELLQTADGANVDVEDGGLGVLVLLPEVSGLLQRSHAADRRTIGKMVLVPRSGTLHERHVLRLLAVGRPNDLPAGGAPLAANLSIMTLVITFGISPESQVVELGGIVRSPAGRHDDGPDLDLDLFLCHVQINSPGWTDLRQFRGVGIGQGLSIEDIIGRISHIMRQIERLGLVHPQS